MSDEARLIDLVVRYEDLQKQGTPVSPEELCRDAPGLLERLKHAIAGLERLRARGIGWEVAPLRAQPDCNTVESERRGETIPGYELLHEIDRGGMGVVYRARDRKFDRDVAIKTLSERAENDSSVVNRFLVEARITAQLQHPGIPAAHDLGTLPDGRPFLVMKLVKGKPLDVLLEARRAATEDHGRFLAIFEQICHAVGYAHSHRVIHRDLKPRNVMAGAFGEVHVMDWGLAKVLRADGTDSEANDDPQATAVSKTAIDTPGGEGSNTREGSFIGTPAYAPPEQAGGEIRRLDVRSDVFGLGAILCQILTGKPPYEGQTANDVKLKAVRAELSEAFARIDACGVEADVVALCKRCLAGEQQDRPADGQAVAAEVSRIRQAVEERARVAERERGEAMVREKEERKRRRQLLVAAGVVGTVLVLGIVGTSVGMVWAYGAAKAEQHAKNDAEERRSEAEQERNAKGKALEKEARQRKFAQAVADFVKDDFLALTSVEGQYRFGGETQTVLDKDATLRQLLDRAAAKLDMRDDLDPLIEAELRWMIGVNYRALGETGLALPFLQKALALRREVLGLEDVETLNAANSLGVAYMASGRPDLAQALLEETLKLKEAELGTDHLLTLGIMNNLAMAYYEARNYNLAVPLLEKTLNLRKAKLGEDHPDTLTSMNNLALGYHAAGKLDLALPLYEETLQLTKTKMGNDHPDTLCSMHNLACAYWSTKQLDKSIPLFEEVLKLQEQKLGRLHLDTQRTVANLGVNYRDAHRLAEAIPLLQEAFQSAKSLPALHFRWVSAELLDAYVKAGKTAEASELVTELVTEARKQHAAGSAELAGDLAQYGLSLLEARGFSHAERLLLECLAIREKKEPDAWTTFNAQSLLGAALLGQEKYADAEPLLLRGCDGMKKLGQQIRPKYESNLIDAISCLVQLYDATGKSVETEKWRMELEETNAVTFHKECERQVYKQIQRSFAHAVGTQWVSETGKFQKNADMLWIETDSNGRYLATFRECDADVDYVELLDSSRDIGIRLFPSQMDLRYPMQLGFSFFKSGRFKR